MNVVVNVVFLAFAALTNVVSILEAAAVTFEFALLNALIKPVIPASPSFVNAEPKDVIPLVSNPAIPVAISTSLFVCVITLDNRPVSIPLI